VVRPPERELQRLAGGPAKLAIGLAIRDRLLADAHRPADDLLALDLLRLEHAERRLDIERRRELLLRRIEEGREERAHRGHVLDELARRVEREIESALRGRGGEDGLVRVEHPEERADVRGIGFLIVSFRQRVRERVATGETLIEVALERRVAARRVAAGEVEAALAHVARELLRRAREEAVAANRRQRRRGA